MNTGRYIAIEGPPGASKTAQIVELQRRLQAASLQVKTIVTTKPSALKPDIIERLINDPSYPMKNQAEVTVYDAVRSKHLTTISQARDQGVICLTDRSALGGLVEHYYGHGTVSDYEVINRITRFASDDIQPDLTIVLDTPTDASAEDAAYLERLRAGCLWEAKQRHLPVVFTVDDFDKVSDKLWQLVSGNLAQRGPGQPTAVKEVIEAMHPAAGPDIELTTTDTGNVYALKTAPSVSVKALQQLSSSDQDLRTAILPPLTGKGHAAQSTDYNFVVAENVSLLSLLSLRDLNCWQRPLQLQNYHKKDAQGRYRYLIPKNLDKKTKANYKQTMDAIFDLYSGILQGLSAHNDAAAAFQMAQAVLPVAATSDIGWRLPITQTSTVISDLSSHPSREVQDVAKHLAGELQKLHPNDAPVKTITPQQGTTFADTAATNLSGQYSLNAAQPVRLLSHWPRNELDLLPYMLYEHSGLSFAEIRDEVANWSYDQKSTVFTDYFVTQNQPGAAPVLQNTSYSWDMLTDFITFTDMQQAQLISNAHWQGLTPRNGYEVPKVIEDAGLSNDFERCFDLSLELHSQLQAAGYLFEAQYATLQGHKLRWTVTQNASQYMKMISFSKKLNANSEIQRISINMSNRLSEIYPLVFTTLVKNLNI